MVFDRLKTPIGRNIIANFFAVGINLFNQILLIPIFLIYWGNQKYSDWIILTALSSFFSMTDIGLNSVTSNNFSVTFIRKDFAKCEKLLINNIVLIISIAVFSICILLIFCFSNNLPSLLSLHVTSSSVANIVFILLVFKIFVGMLSNCLCSIYRANSVAYIGVYLSNISKVLEISILAISVVTNLTFQNLIWIYILPSIFLLIYILIDTRKYYKFKFSLKKFDYPLFRNLLIPSFSFLSFPLGNAIILQGFSLLINKYYGSDSLIIYNTTRTLTNFVKSVTGNILSAIWPEFTIAYGKHDYKLMKNIHRKALKSVFVMSVVISVILCLFGNLIFNIWTKGLVQFNLSLMIAFLLVLICNNIWNTSKVALVATNNHQMLGLYYIIFTTISLLIGGVISSLNMNMVFVVYSLLLSDIFLAYYTVNKGLILTKDKFIH